jgi:lipopolysaccharide export system protein LptA
MGSKIRASMKIITTPLLLAALTLSCASALAERADRDKPMTIDADALRHDDLKQITVFTGAVTVTKGTILMRGARIEIRQDGQGNQFGILTPDPGKLVFFRQKRDGLDEFMEGEGERIEYDSATDTVRILRRGELRRLVGTKVADEISGDLIVYNNTTEVFTVDGKPGDPGRNGRVRAVLAPRAPASAASSAGAAAPASAGASQSAPSLRSSGTLGGDRK